MVDLVLNGVAVYLAGSLAVTAWRQRRHIRALRGMLPPGVVDTYRTPCQCCGRRLKDSSVLVCQERREYPDGRVETILRAWHSDRPRCSAACAADDQVAAVWMGGDIP